MAGRHYAARPLSESNQLQLALGRVQNVLEEIDRRVCCGRGGMTRQELEKELGAARRALTACRKALGLWSEADD
jgi:hypothetical protein